ncbi:zinc transporter, ZIP family [Geosmithia morbida]|uniref:Zinc transporter, ZIP family n=1 Tax=Geosmithia morbida TaxID=1094350 RepID=A0A9P4YQ96_9HYPO|nr:zinc transporter, ZIP family [Geosmithia morbida]KAF4121146.1 zinc transporter, ZIP family [Geosmithia morbida]
MLPESKSYLKRDGWSDQPAGLIMMVGFIAGFFGIQTISRLLHRYIPSHVVDCTHSHAAQSHNHGHGEPTVKDTVPSSERSRTLSRPSRPRHRRGHPSNNGSIHQSVESTPLLGNGSATTRNNSRPGTSHMHMPPTPSTSTGVLPTAELLSDADRRPSMLLMQSRVMSFVKDTKSNCDAQGSCYGFTDPCGQECYKHLHGPRHEQTTVLRSGLEQQCDAGAGAGAGAGTGDNNSVFCTSRATSRDPLEGTGAQSRYADEDDSSFSSSSYLRGDDGRDDDHHHSHDDQDPESQHHHHVPTNAFLSIGLQTSMAIALHKLPEGFITYATNHANPSLGFNVFMALFIHNISEGFAMALPLYMALRSRWRAMLWSTLLGGLSQPFGAGLAALWFRFATRHAEPDPVVYACLFAVTAGIMVSVALQLFIESLSLNHDRNLCSFFGFLGMVLLGVSNALFSSH